MRTCLVAAVVVVVSASARAEVVEVGGAAGMVTSTMKQTFPDCSDQPDCIESAEAHAPRRGIASGLFVRYPIVRALLVQAELAYVQKGFETTLPSLRVDYLEVPVLLRIDPLRHRLPVRFAFLGGLAPAVRARCRQSGSFFMNGAGVPYDDRCEDAPRVDDMRAYPARFDLGLVVGATLAVESPIGVFEVEARSERGLVDNGAWGPGGRTAFESYGVRFGYAYAVGR
ncbi:MAG: PorT family protein [Kofleriaceae bacterium]|nr:PorT family protein [Kofleriaceae bacterium]